MPTALADGPRRLRISSKKSANSRPHSPTDGKDPANLREEFADVLAWLCTLANVAKVDLPAAVIEKYFSAEAPQGTK